MNYVLKKLYESDRDKIAADALASEELKNYKIIRNVLEHEETLAIDTDSDNYLIKIGMRMREESDNVNYYLYFSGHFIHIRKLKLFWNSDVSFQNYPESLEGQRETVKKIFGEAIETFGLWGYGSLGMAFGKKYNDQRFTPNFVEDNVVPGSL